MTRDVPVAYAAFDAQGVLVEISSRLAALLGRGVDDLVGARLWDVAAPGQKNRVINEIQRGRDGFELDLVKADGRRIALHAVGVRYAEDRMEIWLAPPSAARSDAAATERALRRQNAILLDLGKADVIDAGHLDDAFARITEAVSAGLGCARASIWLYDEGETAIVCQDLFQHADGSHGAKGFTLKAADYPGYFAALAEDRTIAADDCRAHPATREFTEGYLVPLGITSMLEAPIRRRGKLIGVLCNEHVGPIRSFSQEEQNFAANVADFVARALEASDRRAASEALQRAHAALEAHAADLERRVAERTRAIQLVLDSTGDGLLSCDLEGVLAAECSAAVCAWFGTPPHGSSLAAFLFGPGVAADVFELGLEQLRDDVLPFDLVVEQMPREFVRGGRTFRVRYRPVVEADRLVRLLLVVRDATAEIEAERAQREARELQAVASHVMRDRGAFAAFLEECDALVGTVASSRDCGEVRRALHTLKGSAAVFGLESVAEAAHRSEDRLAQQGSVPAAASEAVDAWREARARIEATFGDRDRRVVTLDETEYERFVRDLSAARVGRELVEQVQSWRSLPTRSLLERLARQVERVAARAGKPVHVEIRDPGTRLPREDMGAFWTGLVHVVRNAVDHGLEETSVRLACGKPAVGRVVLEVERDAEQFAVAIRDDGRGIDWEAVARKAAALGLAASSPIDLERALFHEGLSTRDEVTDLSGRGVGLGAVRAAVHALGGRVHLETESGAGTCFRFVFPTRPATAMAA
jgi:signal transduction histidine kinase